MKYTILFFMILITSLILSAQKAVLNIVDEDDQLLDFVAVVDEQGGVLAYSDNGGIVELALDCSRSTYILNYFGYDDYTLELDCQQMYEKTVKLTPSVISLKTINVVGHSSADQASKPYQVATIGKQQLRQFQSQTTVEALEQNGGAYIQRSQMGGGSPILRGFEANKVLLVIDGVRMNNAIYRSGHLQNAISVDQAVLDNISTLYGPGSILYGSDALGGVIHFQTLRPKFSTTNKPNVSGGYYLRYASVNEERSGHAHVNFASKSFASLTSISYSKYGDLKSGKNHPSKYPNFGKRTFYVDPETDEIIPNENPEEQIFTGYDQTDVLQKFTYKLNEKKFIGLNIQYSTTTDIPRYDELTITNDVGIPETSEWYYGPQKRLLTSLRFDSDADATVFDRYQIQAAYQKLNEDRHSRDFMSPDLISNFETVDVYSANLDFYKTFGGASSTELSYGFEYRYNQVNSEAERFNKETGVVTNDVFTRYPSDNSKMFDAGVYALYQIKKERLTAQFGGRFNWNKLDVKYSRDDFFDWPEYFYSGINQSNIALTWLAGMNYKLAEQTNFRLFTGTAYRSPNVDDFAKIRVRTSSSISIPNPDLSPEKTWNIELGLQQGINTANDGKINIGVTGYYTRINDAIIREAFALPDGATTYLYNGNDLEVQANVNANKGYIAGVSFLSDAKLSSAFNINGSISWQRGRSIEDGLTQPLAHIPPLYGQATLNYRKNKWNTSFKCVFNGKKKLEDFAPGSSDNDDLATPEGSLAWTSLNLYGSYKFNSLFEMKAGIENMLDLHYRTFSSGLSAPGRNFKIGLYGNF